MRAVLISLAFILGTGTALADRPLTQEESDKLNAALKQEGCSGGKMEFEDGKFEVDNAVCADGKTYDLDFDSSFRLIKKKQEQSQATPGSGPAGKPLPKLVLFLVVDGFPQEQLVKYYDQYSDRGLKLLLDKGGWYGNNHYSHATTYTGVGHASVRASLQARCGRERLDRQEDGQAALFDRRRALQVSRRGNAGALRHVALQHESDNRRRRADLRQRKIEGRRDRGQGSFGDRPGRPARHSLHAQCDYGPFHHVRLVHGGLSRLVESLLRGQTAEQVFSSRAGRCCCRRRHTSARPRMIGPGPRNPGILERAFRIRSWAAPRSRARPTTMQ